MATRRGRAFSGSVYSVISIVLGSILAILLVSNSQKKGTPLLLIAIPYGCESLVGTFFKSIFPARGSSLPTTLATCAVNHIVPCASKTAVCGSSTPASGILYSVTDPVRGSSLPIYPAKFPVNHTLPFASATKPCGPEFSSFSGYSLNVPLAGSSRPILFIICSVNHSAPSAPTAGSWGCAPLVGTAHSRMLTFNSVTSAAAPGDPDANSRPSAQLSITAPRIATFRTFINSSNVSPPRQRRESTSFGDIYVFFQMPLSVEIINGRQQHFIHCN